VRETGFTSDEVAEFRQIFLAADENGDGELTLEEAREMVMRVCPFSSEHHNQFNKIFAEVAQKQMHLEGSGDEADFPEFLWLMRSILDADFASVAKQSSTFSKKSFTERRSTRMAKDGAFRGTRTRRTTSKQFADLQPVKERPDFKG
jgi:Ca2+-binding EF-hand superfamily protein